MSGKTNGTLDNFNTVEIFKMLRAKNKNRDREINVTIKKNGWYEVDRVGNHGTVSLGINVCK